MAQDARTGRRLDERDADATAAARLGAPELGPMRGTEPVGIGTRCAAGRGVEQDRAVSHRLDLRVAHASAKFSDPIRAGSPFEIRAPEKSSKSPMDRSQTPAPPPASLCLLRTSALGDVTHVVPLVRTLQARWPETRLTWLIGRLEQKLVGDLGGV